MSTLDYASPKQKYRQTQMDRTWRRRRVGYYLGHVLLFALIVCGIGPNMFLFHSPFSPAPEHYAALTGQYVPLIAAIKAYQRDFGKLPFSSDTLPKDYRPVGYASEEGQILGTTSITFGLIEYSVIEYNFSPFTEGWKVYAPRYKGPIPAPLVQAAPAPAIRSSTGPTTHAAE